MFFTGGAGYIGSPCVVELMELALVISCEKFGKIGCFWNRVIKEITLTLPRNKSLERIIHYTVVKKLTAKKLNLNNRAEKRPIDNSPSKDSSSSSFRAEKEKSKLQKELLSSVVSAVELMSQVESAYKERASYGHQASRKVRVAVHEKTLNQGSSIAEIQLRKYHLFEDQLTSSQINSNICVVALKTYEHAALFTPKRSKKSGANFTSRLHN
ncbi:hypothetical protein DAPPUDRAFT_226200 [Daphnia pulex]|uniref:Uncharacterized protein n=1 Tax=Daphnia pulex TaxID=6669 RepID=E9GX42_DAPPU|nr:hypothetical protein DAPPUDRAFT_226200 [Daphnia pulex]|eukprot:EFX75929.1 hypothetical protein DAPPUDRAFT_226200 [Daphnia pulex]